MKNLKKEILKKIEKKEIKKIPRWVFIIQKIFLWFSFIFSIFLGALSFSIFIKNFFDDYGPWYKIRIESSFILSNIFLIWLSFLLIFIILAYWNFKKTKNGFKYKVSKIIIFLITVSILLGSVFHYTCLDKKIEHLILKSSPQYKKIKERKYQKILNYLEKNNINKDDFFQYQKNKKKKCR